MFATVIAATFALVPLYIDHPTSTVLLERWKPQAIAGTVVSVSGVAQYARAKILLSTRPEVQGLLMCDEDRVGPLFLFHTQDDHTVLETVCWTTESIAGKIGVFSDLKRWHEGTHQYLVAGNLLDEDVAFWNYNADHE
jgi:hypothetical protein